MKENFKLALKLYGKMILSTVMAFFIVLSISVVATEFMTEDTGYKAYGVKGESEEREFLYEYSKSQGKDTERAKYEEQGYTIIEQNTFVITKTGNAVFLTTVQIFSLMILISFLYSFIWNVGIKDNNLVKFGHKSEDKLRGVKIGLIASIPYCVFVLVLFVLRFITSTNVSIALIEFINAHFYSFTRLLLGQQAFLDVSFIRMLGLLLLGCIVPIITGVSYLIGYKDISLSEKLLYKKRKK